MQKTRKNDKIGSFTTTKKNKAENVSSLDNQQRALSIFPFPFPNQIHRNFCRFGVLEFGNGIPNHSYDSLEMEMNLVKLWNGMEMEFGMSKVFGNGIGLWNRMHVAGVSCSDATNQPCVTDTPRSCLINIKRKFGYQSSCLINVKGKFGRKLLKITGICLKSGRAGPRRSGTKTPQKGATLCHFLCHFFRYFRFEPRLPGAARARHESGSEDGSARPWF